MDFYIGLELIRISTDEIGIFMYLKSVEGIIS